VSTYVQGAECDTAATQGVSDAEVFGDLLLEVGGSIAVEEQEFGTDQAGAVCSFSSRRVGVGAGADVGGDLDPGTVAIWAARWLKCVSVAAGPSRTGRPTRLVSNFVCRGGRSMCC
jgi:hypothetical protein